MTELNEELSEIGFQLKRIADIQETKSWSHSKSNFAENGDLSPDIQTNLSEKIIDKEDKFDYCKDKILVEDVKEFIRRFKDSFEDDEIDYSKQSIIERLDRLVGDKLK